MHTRVHEYELEGQTHEGFVAVPEGDGPHPLVLVAHAWNGQADFDRDKATMLAELGYIGFAIDMFGKGNRGETMEECSALIAPFTEDRSKIRAGILKALEVAKALPEADASRVAAIGFCFGGMTVLDLARSGEDVRGVVSFHGLLGPSGLDAAPIKAKVLALHGYDDPMGPPEDLAAFLEEMNAGGADFQVHAYGQTVHAFTVPDAADHAHGIVYNEVAAKRAFASMKAFLAEILA